MNTDKANGREALELPIHPDPHAWTWTEAEKRVILAWGESLLSASQAQRTETSVAWNALTDDDRDRAFQTLPDMLDGFMKKWGWLHFAKAVEDICREKNPPASTAPVASPIGYVDAEVIEEARKGYTHASIFPSRGEGDLPIYAEPARAVHAKVRNQRRDALHKFSTALVQQNGAIFVGDVSSSKMIKLGMAKSTHDAGWSMFKTMLEYKCRQAGVVFGVVNENYTTQTCNVCGVIAGPKGRAGLNKRVWQCECGTVHDRDVNAALNIRARGLASLEAGAGAFTGDRSSQHPPREIAA